MELLNKKTINGTPRIKEVRKGDWVCHSCQNYNYSFRTFCNRCRIQTRQQNDEQTAIIMKDKNCLIDHYKWETNFRQTDEDPMLNINFPKILLVTPSKMYPESKIMSDYYQAKSIERKSDNQLNWQESFQVENMKWLSKLIEQ